ncbi:UEV domain-containing protein [Scheffersomyces amazonensis]|uniref:UEV domain-containing protein n=1 Tax=Scheffersomyces amazonensis TaxID=1078765 RepID=UPI00315CB1F7
MPPQLPTQVANWLYNVLQPQYVHKEWAYKHIYQLLQVHLKQNFNFKIRTNVYTSTDSGHSALLINLYGSIPINSELEVPIEIWVPLNYPFIDPRLSPSQINNGIPLVYIVPDHSKSLYLKPGNHVDSQGRFYHPYLANWQRDVTFDQSQYNQELLDQYNLLGLLNIIHQAILADPPISIRPIGIDGPPPVPAKINLNGSQTSLPSQATGPIPPPPTPPAAALPQQVTGLPPQSTGPPLPAKPPKEPMQSIPLKYQAPLPLPDQGATPIQTPPPPPPPPQVPTPIQAPAQFIQPHQQPYQQYSQPAAPTAISPQAIPIRQITHQQFERHHPIQYSSPLPAQQYPVQSGYYSNVSSPTPTPQSTSNSISVLDLIDDDQQQDGNVVQSSLHRQLLEQLSSKFNACLDQDPINTELASVNLNIEKVDALYNQLNHHFQQANGNSNNLDEHLNYLTQQLTVLSSLNQELSSLEALNTQHTDKVWLSQNNSIDLDDLIIPDSPLVKQLYDTVAEIKSIKDTINLISGNFHQGPEFINNNSTDLCVKTVRNLGRELFWLELTKHEIATNIMGLSHH